LSLEALIDAINYKDMVSQRQQNAKKEIVDLNNDIAKIGAGKFTFGGIFKSDASKQQGVVKKKAMVVELEKDVENYDIIRKYLTIYLANIAIPSFKKERVEAYVRAMGCMTFEEIANSEAVVECFLRFQEVIADYNIQGSMPN
jgi:hypothetical protein